MEGRILVMNHSTIKYISSVYQLEEFCMKLASTYFFIIIALTTFASNSFTTNIVSTEKNIAPKELNVDIIEFILKYRITLLKMLYGTPRVDGSLDGSYKYGEKKYSIHTLAASEKHAEQNNINHETLEKTLLEANKDFIEKTTYFLTFAKKINIHVFEEIFFRVICMKVFEMQKQTISFQYLEQLLTEVLSALNKLIESSPKATDQCYKRATKWQKIKTIIAELQDEGFIEEEFDTINFLRFVKHNYLDVFLLGEFTKDQIEIILDEYISCHP